MRLLHHRYLAHAFLGLFLILGFIYSVANPIFEAPDEVFHYPYIKHLADGQGLPVQRLDAEQLWEQEGSQPPLYYALGALLTRWIDTDDLSLVRVLNPHARIGIPLARDNKNMVLHTARECWPWRGTTLAVRIVRSFSLLLGAGTLWCSYRLARALVPQHPNVALGTLALAALNPMFLFISGSVNNDNLVILLASLSVLRMVRLLERGTTPRALLLLGVLIGLACLSKLSGLGLLPLAALALLLAHLRDGQRAVSQMTTPAARWAHLLRAWMRDLALLLLPVVLIAGWWYLRNWRLYGDPSGLNRMLEIFGRRHRSPGVIGLLQEFEGFRISYWGLFGVVNVLLQPHWLYKVLDALTLMGALGLGLTLWRRRHDGLPANWPGLLLAAAWIVIVFLALLRWTSLTKASQGRLAFPAIGCLSLFLSLGLLAWFPPRMWSRVVLGLALALGILAVSAPFVSIRAAYRRPKILSPADVSPTANPYLATYGGVMRLLAHEVDTRPVPPGGEVAVTLYWQSLAPIEENLSVYIHLFGWDGQRLGQRDSYTGGGMYPTSLWSPGEIIRDTYYVPVRKDAIGPVAAKVVVGLYRLQTMDPLPVVDAQGTPIGQPVLTRVKVAVPTKAVQPQHPLGAELGGMVRLLGYDLPADWVAAGGEMPVTLYWQVVRAPDRDYHVFLHLSDAEGQLVGQGDGPPLGDNYPTSFWGAGEMLTDRHTLRVRADTPGGEYFVVTGLYDLASGQRLPVVLAVGGQQTDRVPLGSVRVEERASAILGGLFDDLSSWVIRPPGCGA